MALSDLIDPDTFSASMSGGEETVGNRLESLGSTVERGQSSRQS